MSEQKTRLWFWRLYVALHVLVMALLANVSPDTMIYRVIQASGVAGMWCMAALAAMAAVTVLDVLINDLMPDRFTINPVKNNRHFLYIGMAMGLTCMAFVLVKKVGFNAVLASIFLQVTAAAYVAFTDLFARLKKS